MEIIYLLAPLSLLLGGVFLLLCIWAIRSGQFNDKDRGDMLPLRDDDK